MRQAMAAGSERIGMLTRSTVTELDRLYAARLTVPDAVRQAVETLTAFSIALAYNAQGHPTPSEFRKALGLD